MKKIFTIAFALMATLSLMAADFEPTAVYRVGDASTLGAQWKTGLNNTANYYEVADTVIFSPYVLYQSAAAGWQEWTGCAGSGSTGTTWNAIAGRCFQGSTAMFSSSAKAATTRSTRTYYYHVTNCSQVMLYAKSSSTITLYLRAIEIGTTDTISTSYKSGSNGIISLEGLDITKTYRIVVTADKDSNCSFYEIAFVGPQSTEPSLNVSSESLNFAATVANPNPSATVTFTGKNLTPGTYNLTTPGAGSWTVNPTQVTVGEDGKLNATITVGYTLNEYVESETSSISLTINNITKTVALNATSEASINYINASVNIEGLVVENGKGYNIKGAFAAANIEYSNVDALDSLNNSKTARNEPYLGLKIKKADGYVAGWLQAGHTIRVKFGFVDSDSVKVFLGDQMAKFGKGQLATPLEFTALEDTYVKIQTTSGKTVVLKQIMLDAPIVDVMYTITYAAAEHGTVSGWTIAYPDEEIKLSFTMDEGYTVSSCYANNVEIVGIPNVGEFFTMPAEHVTVVATFGDVLTDIDNTDAAVKSVKFFQNGQLFIEKNGVIYNAQGTIVK